MAVPVKTRELHNHHFDSTIWNDLVFCDDESRWERIVEYCSFDWMKQNATKSVPAGGAFWDAGAQVFINKGVAGRWKEVLNPEEVAEYETRAVQELGPDCARWLMAGQ